MTKPISTDAYAAMEAAMARLLASSDDRATLTIARLASEARLSRATFYRAPELLDRFRAALEQRNRDNTTALLNLDRIGELEAEIATPRADKCAIRRHEPCEHRRHELDGLDLLAMLLRKNLGVIRTLGGCLTGVMSQRHASARKPRQRISCRSSISPNWALLAGLQWCRTVDRRPSLQPRSRRQRRPV